MGWRTVFLGPGGLRAGWRLLAFVAIANAVVAVPFLALRSFGVRPPSHLTPALVLAGQLVQFAGALAAAAIMARIERGRLAAYGLTARGAFGAQFWQGALWGIAAVSAVVGMIAIGGGYLPGAPAPRGAALVKAVAVWALATTAIGLNEELQYRGHGLFTLASGMRFWPAALLVSAVFAAEH